MSEFSGYASLFHEAIESGINFQRLRVELATGFDKLMQQPKFRPNARLWFAGSGDSLFAAQCVLPGLQRWANIDGTALSAIEFSRYRIPLLTEHDALWAVSNSGSAARTRETVSLAQAKGIFAVGITGSEPGPLCTESDTYIFRPVEDLPSIPERNRGIFLNMNEFLVTLYSLYYLGLSLGVVNSHITKAKAEAILDRCQAAISSIPGLAMALEPLASQQAAELKDLGTIWVIGAGPSFGTARYCAAKFHEQLPWNGIPEDLEEWAHLQYFLALSWRQRSAVFVLSPPGNSLDRAEELVEGISEVGGRAYIVANPNHGNFPSASAYFGIPDEKSEFLSPFTYHLPVQLLILHLSRQIGQDPYALRRADGYKLIRHGIVRTDASTLG